MEDNKVPAPAETVEEQSGRDLYSNAQASTETAPPTADDEIQIYPETRETAALTVAHTAEPVTGGGGGTPPGGHDGGGGGGGGDDDEEEEMVKMSFLEHLEELRRRLLYAVVAIAAAFFVCFAFSQRIYEVLSIPIRQALTEMKLPNGQHMSGVLYYNKPTDSFTLFLNLSLVCALFVASPVVLYQVWAFISPGLYKKERRYAVPFVFFCTALFVSGGLFGYFIAFPYALKFLVNFGGPNLIPWITVTEYMDMFWTVILGLGLVFELPVLMMFLGLVRIISPKFLINNFRYAVLIIFVVAAIVTPTSDVMNMMIFAAPMIALFILGIGLVWLVQRKKRPAD